MNCRREKGLLQVCYNEKRSVLSINEQTASMIFSFSLIESDWLPKRSSCGVIGTLHIVDILFISSLLCSTYIGHESKKCVASSSG